MKEYQNGIYTVVWEYPSEDKYHTISEYQNGRVLGFMHTENAEKAKQLFRNSRAYVDSCVNRKGV